MRWIVFSWLVLLAAFATSAQAQHHHEATSRLDSYEHDNNEKIDIRKLVGRWNAPATKDTYQQLIEFRKDGKIVWAILTKGEVYNLSGTYRAEGNKVVITLEDDLPSEDVHIITKLTDAELVWTHKKTNEKAKFTRLKSD